MRDQPPSPRVPAALALLALAAAFAIARSAVASPSGSVVLLAEDPDDPVIGQLLRVAGAQLSDLDVALLALPVAGPPAVESFARAIRSAPLPADTVAVFWIAADEPGGWLLFVAEADGRRLLARSIEQDDESACLEAMGLIVRSATVALLSGGEIGVAIPAPGEGRTDVTPAKPGHERAVRGTVLTGYRLQVRAADSPLHGFRAATVFSLRDLVQIHLGYVFFTPVEARGDPASVEVRRHPIDLGISLCHGWGRWSLAGTVEAVADIAVQRTVRLGGEGFYTKSNDDIVWSAAFGLEVRFSVSSRLSFHVEGGVEAPLNPVRYVFEGAEGPVVIEEGWRAQPRAGAGATVRFL